MSFDPYPSEPLPREAGLMVVEPVSYADLVELERRGYITKASTFAEHMSPDVIWIDNEDFAAAFAAECEEPDTMPISESKDEAALQLPSGEYIRMFLTDDKSAMRVLFRGDNDGDTIGDAPGMTIPVQDFDDLLARAHLVRTRAHERRETHLYGGMEATMTATDEFRDDGREEPGVDDLPTASEEMLDLASETDVVELAPQAADADDARDPSGGATAGDPLAQRVDFTDDEKAEMKHDAQMADLSDDRAVRDEFVDHKHIGRDE